MIEQTRDKVYLGDCLDVMKGWDYGTIDMILADPPFGLTKNKWDKVIPVDKMWVQLRRLIKRNGVIVLFAQQPFASTLVKSNEAMFKYEWIWEKSGSSGFLRAKYAPLRVHENILVFCNAPASYLRGKGEPMTYHPQMETGEPYNVKRQSNWSPNYEGDKRYMKDGIDTENTGLRYPKDVLHYSFSHRGQEHPTAKPVELLRYLIRTYSNEGDTVLDFCAGSCSTAIAAIRERRHYMCIEKERIFYEAGLKRVMDENSKLSMF